MNCFFKDFFVFALDTSFEVGRAQQEIAMEEEAEKLRAEVKELKKRLEEATRCSRTSCPFCHM
jgi:hypothetical protein